MNSKHLLIAAFVTAFSGINLVASEEVSIDDVIGEYCRENNTELCQELARLMAATTIDLEKVKDLTFAITEEIKNQKNHNILNVVENDAKESIDTTTE